MKNLIVLIFALVLVSCKDEGKSNLNSEPSTTNMSEVQNDGLTTMVGEYVYYADAAVMEIKGSMYGVVMNEKMQELNKMAEAYKEAPTDYVNVKVSGKLIEKSADAEGWPYLVEINEIISVQKSEKDEDDTITLGEDK